MGKNKLMPCIKKKSQCLSFDTMYKNWYLYVKNLVKFCKYLTMCIFFCKFDILP